MPDAPSPVVELLADLETALRAAGISHYLFGAQAALLYGAARLTADVDGMNPVRLVDPDHRTHNRAQLSTEAATADRVLKRPGAMGVP